jgi:hypothetical protein
MSVNLYPERGYKGEGESMTKPQKRYRNSSAKKTTHVHTKNNARENKLKPLSTNFFI